MKHLPTLIICLTLILATGCGKKEEKAKGVKFFPDIVYKDTIVAFAIFILLVGLALFVGVPEEPPADPTPRRAGRE